MSNETAERIESARREMISHMAVIFDEIKNAQGEEDEVFELLRDRLLTMIYDNT